MNLWFFDSLFGYFMIEICGMLVIKLGYGDFICVECYVGIKCMWSVMFESMKFVRFILKLIFVVFLIDWFYMLYIICVEWNV